MCVGKKWLNILVIFFEFYLALLIFPKSDIFAFSMEITGVEPSTVENAEQIVTVTISINDLPVGDSYFRAGWKSGNTYIGYVQNNNGEWVKLRALSEGCSDYYKVSNAISSLQLNIKLSDFIISNGSYVLKAHRFTSTCSSNSGSNEFPTYINFATPTTTPTLVPTLIPTKTVTPTPTLTIKPTPTLTPKPTLIAAFSITSLPKNPQITSEKKDYSIDSGSSVYPTNNNPSIITPGNDFNESSVAAEVAEFIATKAEDKKLYINESNKQNIKSPVLLFLLGGVFIIAGVLIPLVRNYKVRE